MDQKLTTDTLFDGELQCSQYRTGYRFSIDSILLAHFIRPKKNSRILDLGCGCGVISLILLYRHTMKIQWVDGLELQPELAQLANKNFNDNSFSSKATCVVGNVRKILRYCEPESYDAVICNPPFYTVSEGRQNSNPQARIARHLIDSELGDFTQGAASVVKNGGEVFFIFPAERFIELNSALSASRLVVKTVRFIYSYPLPETDARLVLIRAVKNGGAGVKICPPLYVYTEKEGSYHPEIASYYAQNPRS